MFSDGGKMVLFIRILVFRPPPPNAFSSIAASHHCQSRFVMAWQTVGDLIQQYTKQKRKGKQKHSNKTTKNGNKNIVKITMLCAIKAMFLY